MNRGTIDSIDEGRVRIALDGGGICNLPSSSLPSGAREGDRVELAVRVLPEETRRAREALARKRASLVAPDDEGDIEL